MKKTIAFALLVVSFAGLSAFGQGYFLFTTGKSQVWDDFSVYPPATSSDVDVAFLWAAEGDVPAVDSILVSTPTTGSLGLGGTLEAWPDILSDPNFTLAVNSGAGNSLASVQCTSKGAISYDGGTAFAGPLATSPGVTYTLFMIGWDASYATPLLAALDNAAVGWSAPFNYTTSSLTSTPESMQGLTPAFGVGGIPEPTSMAVAGLGGLSLLLLRRRK